MSADNDIYALPPEAEAIAKALREVEGVAIKSELEREEAADRDDFDLTA